MYLLSLGEINHPKDVNNVEATGKSKENVHHVSILLRISCN